MDTKCLLLETIPLETIMRVAPVTGVGIAKPKVAIYVLHALWFLRVWSLRASTRFLKKIRVCQYPFVPIFKGIFQSQYSYFQIIYCKGMVHMSKRL